jgi:prephenate dehydratase
VTSPSTRRYGYFGPPGTFTQAALLAWPEANPAGPGIEHVAYPSVDATLAAVRAQEVDVAVVPIENSVEGGVSATLDNLATGDPLVIVGEVLVPITFVLAARPGVTLADVTAVGTHSHAWAQVRGWVAANLPHVSYVPTLSTAAAAVGLRVGAGDLRGMPSQDALYQACICAPVAAQTNGLVELAHDIGDISGAVTRFVAVAHPGNLPERTGRDKTTVVLYQKEDRAGGLLELLEQFAARGINMTRLESRPTGESMGSYCFSIDAEGHVLDERIGEALMGLKRVCADVVFLGSYPRADRGRPSIAEGMSDADFATARDWLGGIRTGQ